MPPPHKGPNAFSGSACQSAGAPHRFPVRICRGFADQEASVRSHRNTTGQLRTARASHALATSLLWAIACALPASAQPEAREVLERELTVAAAPRSDTRNRAWDPRDGVEDNGRIPAVVKNVRNPERWRYIPEGRIMPGPLWERFLVSTFATPLVFRDEDIGVGGGLAVLDIDFRDKRRREFAGIFGSYTSEGQQAYGFTWRRWLYTREHPDGGVLQEDRSFVRLAGGYSKTLTRRFFGLGADTRVSDETSYEDEIFDLDLSIAHALPDPGGDWILSGGVRAEFHELAPGAIDSDPTTDQSFPGIFGAAEHHDLGWLHLGLHWDTRDSQVHPYRGTRIGVQTHSALLQRGGDLGARILFDGRHAIRVPPLFHDEGDPDEENPPTDTLVFLLETSTTAGDLPFFSLPALGGSERLRGYVTGRYRDRNHWFAGGEWRVWVLARGFKLPYTRAIRVERLGLAPFVEAGSVAKDWDDLFSSRVRGSVGLGLRIALERTTMFRADVGFAGEGLNLSARVGVAF